VTIQSQNPNYTVPLNGPVTFLNNSSVNAWTISSAISDGSVAGSLTKAGSGGRAPSRVEIRRVTS
jgi:hypothetical protein